LLGRDFAAPEIIGDFPAPEGELSEEHANYGQPVFCGLVQVWRK